MGRRSRGRSRLSLLAITIAAALAVNAVAVASAQAAKNPIVGAAYTQTNDPVDNEVVAYDRKEKGQLKLRASVATGGEGTSQNVGCGANCPILDSQYAVLVHPAGFVFAVNAGSDTITSLQDNFLIKGKGRIKRKDKVPSGGDMPESLALSPDGQFLYVLNVNTQNADGTTGNIMGFEVSEKGKLDPIPGSEQNLLNFSPPEPPASAPGEAATARGIVFSPDGRFVVVSELAGDGGAPFPGAIDVFPVNRDGVASAGVESPSARPFPFGARFDDDGHLIVPNIESPVANVANPPVEGTVTTYNLNANGTVTPIETENTNGVLPCWVAITPEFSDERGGSDGYVYVINTGAGPPPSITRYEEVGPGLLDFRGELVGDDFASTDAEVSIDGKFLYVLNPSVGVPGAQESHIDGYKIKSSGGLKPIGQSPRKADLGPGTTGLAVI